MSDTIIADRIRVKLHFRVKPNVQITDRFALLWFFSRMSMRMRMSSTSTTSCWNLGSKTKQHELKCVFTNENVTNIYNCITNNFPLASPRKYNIIPPSIFWRLKMHATLMKHVRGLTLSNASRVWRAFWRLHQWGLVNCTDKEGRNYDAKAVCWNTTLDKLSQGQLCPTW